MSDINFKVETRYHGLPPVLYADNGASQAGQEWDAGKFNRQEADAKYRQRRKEGRQV